MCTYTRICAHTQGATPQPGEHSLGKAYEVLVVGIHISQLNIDEKHDLQGSTSRRANRKDATKFKNVWQASREIFSVHLGD